MKIKTQYATNMELGKICAIFLSTTSDEIIRFKAIHTFEIIDQKKLQGLIIPHGWILREFKDNIYAVCRPTKVDLYDQLTKFVISNKLPKGLNSMFHLEKELLSSMLLTKTAAHRLSRKFKDFFYEKKIIDEKTHIFQRKTLS